jgi:molybdopterin synthase catalytic subunit
MRITARAFASLRELSVDRCELELGSAATVEDAWSMLQARFPVIGRSVAGSGMGAIVTFVGRARDVADDGRTVIELEYEAYAEMVDSVLDEIRTEAEQRFGVACAVVHRSGLVPIGEAAVAIVTAARHRAEAYEANRFVIEAIKDRLPVWKRERFADGSEWKRPGA